MIKKRGVEKTKVPKLASFIATFLESGVATSQNHLHASFIVPPPHDIINL